MVTQINNQHAEEDALTRVLLQKKLITQSELEKIKLQAVNFQQTIFQHLLQNQFISPGKFQKACSDFFNIKSASLNNITEISSNEMKLNVMKNNFLLPLHIKNKTLVVGISNPNDINIAKKISFQTGLHIELNFIQYDVLLRIHNLITGKQLYDNAQSTKDDFSQKITHQLLSDAIHRNTSDIHIEPYQHCLRIRFRIDGMLCEIVQLPEKMTDAIISCIKVLSHLDIAIKRTPQDGRLSFHSYLGFFKDCRISSCPTIHGEKIVVRLLDANTEIRPIDRLGLSEKNKNIIINSIKKPQGLILVTGPTGSGKTITLYTLLNLLNLIQRNISTIEDPIEMQIEGINQTAVNTKTGLTFSQSLRALLRQDPDVIMLGEIRDHETAEMAIQAAQTGHLVLSTLHTNSAAEAITRLTHMGIAPFHLGSALKLVIAQRLLRKLCAHCKKPHSISENNLVEAKIDTTSHFFEENGCEYCSNGFSGRIGIFEVMPITTEINKLILNNHSHTDIAEKNSLGGNINVWDSGIETLKNGVTSLSEIYRVIQKT
ncbi:MAG: ATPase, T2SS/T4P/T4SS family [Gammaproteobacteria bacterium]|nr:ATPase, T2SS/T4P/T4SS family [Gammaproteobacteria bacterium]